MLPTFRRLVSHEDKFTKVCGEAHHCLWYCFLTCFEQQNRTLSTITSFQVLVLSVLNAENITIACIQAATVLKGQHSHYACSLQKKTLSPRTTKIDSSLPPTNPVAAVVTVAWANKKNHFPQGLQISVQNILP